MNPFLLFMQTFFLGTAGTIGAGAHSVCSVFPAHRFGECAQALEHKLESSDWIPPLPATSSAPFIRRRLCWDSFSGHVSWPPVNITMNPFRLFMQTFFLGTAGTIGAGADSVCPVFPAHRFGECAQALEHKLESSDWIPPLPATSSAPFIRRRLCWDSFSGHVSWPPVNITMNPFLLFMQTFFLGTAGTIGAGAHSVCSVFPAHRFGECAQALEHKLESSDWIPPLPATSSAPFIRRRLCWDSFSGHVSWPPVNITMNPFRLFMQTFFLGTAGTIGAGADSVCPVFPAHRFGECAQALEHKLESSDWMPPPPATSSAPFIRRRLCWDSFSGHVSWPPVNITMNPFLLFMQ
ncbi:hypothetical protein MTO96_042174, partial [Rhipicephalus appendiculatus]